MITRICKWMVFKIVYPVVYFLGSRRAVCQQKVVFVEDHAQTLSSDFELLHEALLNSGYQLKVHYLKMSSSPWSKIVRSTIALLWDISTAKCILLNESNSAMGAFRLRKESKMIQLWHACGAFKKWGFSVADKSFGDDKKNLDMYSGHGNYSLVSVSGDAVVWAYEEAFGLQNKPGVVKALGVSRTDVFFSETERLQAQEAWHKFLNMKRKLKVSNQDMSVQGAEDAIASEMSEKNKKVILYAPTFRGDIRGAKSPDVLDLQYLEKIQGEYVILIKQHPFVKEAFPIPDACQEFCVEIKDEMSIQQLLMLADILVTDYSSIVFEYALMNRPMFFLAHDIEEYYDERGFYYPYEEFVPGPILRSTKELLEELEDMEHYDMEKIEAFCKQYMNGCDGHSTERILAYIGGSKNE